jgi:FkbM family methyltransferase
MKRTLKRFLVSVSGRPTAQRLLERAINYAQALRGIGCGTNVTDSGESAAFRALKSSVQGPYCVFDVGANSGQFLQLAIKHLAPSEVLIHCFEPSSSAFADLATHASLGVTLNNFGLSTEAGRARLHFDVPGSGMASLTRRDLAFRGIQFDGSEDVELDTLDAYCLRKGIERIDLLKIDVEGHELDVMRGGKRVFSNRCVGMVLFEFGGTSIDTRTFFRDFWHFFMDNGFALYRITPSGYLSPMPAYSEREEQFLTMNLLAVHQPATRLLDGPRARASA